MAKHKDNKPRGQKHKRKVKIENRLVAKYTYQLKELIKNKNE